MESQMNLIESIIFIVFLLALLGALHYITGHHWDDCPSSDDLWGEFKNEGEEGKETKDVKCKG